MLQHYQGLFNVQRIEVVFKTAAFSCTYYVRQEGKLRSFVDYHVGAKPAAKI